MLQHVITYVITYVITFKVSRSGWVYTAVVKIHYDKIFFVKPVKMKKGYHELKL